MDIDKLDEVTRKMISEANRIVDMLYDFKVDANDLPELENFEQTGNLKAKASKLRDHLEFYGKAISDNKSEKALRAKAQDINNILVDLLMTSEEVEAEIRVDDPEAEDMIGRYFDALERMEDYGNYLSIVAERS